MEGGYACRCVCARGRIERLAGAVPATVRARGRSVASELLLAPMLDEAPGAVGFFSDAGFRLSLIHI